MFKLIRIELIKIFSKWRSFIGFIAVGALIPIIQVALYTEGDEYFNLFTQTLQQQFDFSGNMTNGYLIAFVTLQSLYVHIPLLIALVIGDLLAGEATAGTYRLLLVRPISRLQVVTSKFLAGLVYTNLLIIWMALLSLGLSVWLFGEGELLIVGDSLTILGSNDILWRFLWAYCYAAGSMVAIASLAFMFSALVENAIGPIASTMAIVIVLTIISTLNAPFIVAIKPYLLTTHLNGWKFFFEQTPNWNKILTSASALLSYVIVFYTAALIVFKRKDILS
ncbi:MAG: ABC transporter permease subunit [Ignavibacteria bacterium]|nr:ABC transporter permease subunit [Ignavibacteria bacterium]